MKHVDHKLLPLFFCENFFLNILCCDKYLLSDLSSNCAQKSACIFMWRVCFCCAVLTKTVTCVNHFSK